MRLENYSNVLQLAAALSLAGWVARTPDSQLHYDISTNSQHRASQTLRYQPYSNFCNGFHQNNCNDLESITSPMVQQEYFSFNHYPHSAVGDFPLNPFYSKDIEESQGAFAELQELISWQESYRRGDLKLGRDNNQHQVLPIVNNNYSPNNQYQTSLIPLSDDGYASASASNGSPSHTSLSDISESIDDTLSSLSPLSEVYDHLIINEHSLEGVEGATGFTPLFTSNVEFDIDEVLGLKKLSTIDNTLDENDLINIDTARRPYANLNYDLEYINSPLKNPNYNDEFLGSPIPGHNVPAGSIHDRSFDDPFNMQFTNSSGGNKFISDTLLDIPNFESSSFDVPYDNNDEDETLMTSLSEQLDKSLVQTGIIKKEELFPDHLVSDHDYPSQMQFPQNLKECSQKLTDNYLRKTNNDVRHNQPSRLSSPIRGRTYAPNTSTAYKKSKVNRQKIKSGLIWPDFLYTSEELIIMPVEMFNEIIKKLNAVKQHVAKDIRRKGKNKLAARLCRRRKMDVIEDLDHGVGTLDTQRQTLYEERQILLEETKQIREKTEWLNSYIFEHLRDSNGHPYSSTDFSLQYTSDGNVYLVPSGKNSLPKKVEV